VNLRNSFQISTDMDGTDAQDEARGEVEAAPRGSREGVRHDYVHGDLSIARIAAKHGISDTTVGDWAKAEGWVRLVGTKPLKTGRKPRPPGAPAPKRPTADQIRRRSLALRLSKVIDAKLQEIETRMQQADASAAPPSAAETERDVRSVSTLMGLYAKLVELNKQARSDTREAAGIEDADQLRRELLRRLERINRQGDA
jgi:transposase-like protein